MVVADITGSRRALLESLRVQGFRSLQFPAPLERAFREEWEAGSIRWVQMFLYVAIGTSIGFSLIDHLVIRAGNALPDIVRYGLQLPVLLICLTATFWKAFRPWYPLAVQLGGPLYGLGTILLVAFAETNHAALIGSRLLLVCFFIFFMSGLRVFQALRSNLIILAMLLAAGAMRLIPTQIATYLAFAYVVGIIIGTAGSYALEYATRSSFLERSLLREMAELDGLTQLLNRQTFDSLARASWQQARARQQPLTLTMLMVDVDNFKLYNDHYGHQAGDACLQRVAAAVREAVATRPGDLIARYGGEEIVAFLPACELAEAQRVAARIVASVGALQIPHAASGFYPHVSVSVGSATAPSAMSANYDVILRHADAALYDAKRSGRNCSVAISAVAV
jgi:diguanylate cyclase (GGDEF)-like protein